MISISEEEKLRRQQASASVIGTHAMEGLTPDATTLDLFRRYEEGDLTLEQFSDAMDRHASALLAALGKMANVA